MKNYVSPVIFDNEELAEGVYATGSGVGDADCWKVTEFFRDQDRATGFPKRTYRLRAEHLTAHISTSCTFEGSVIGTGFDGTVSLRANQSDYVCTIDSTKFSVTRQNHANSEYSVDKVDLMLELTLPDSADLELQWPTPIRCVKTDGVNSGMD